ncbi:ROK family transcriptional regulator [Streptomyces sp. NPDC046203]|uniref:ROK family transcriptional regulator n=1 Tax=Streptomyces sp. NPDC046203 TaxID=3154602 RepID=UPI0033D0E2E0
MAASPSTARALNDRLALRLLQDAGPLTATQLKTLTGLSRPTVADLVDRLQTGGLVHVVGEAGVRRRGPNARLYGIVADRAHLAALDVRTRSVSVVVADLLGTTLAEATLLIDGDAPGPAAERAVELLERTARAAGAARLHSVAVGAPGLIDPATRQLRDTAKLPEWHRLLVAALQQRLPATVVVENEVNLAAVAELREGAARDGDDSGDDRGAGGARGGRYEGPGRDTFVLLWLGQGIGAAVVLDGRLRRGASGGAGEIGFLPVPGTSGLPSAHGCDGGFDELACAASIDALARTHGLDPATALESGHPAFLDELAGRLALGVASVAAVLDPGRVILAGETGHRGGPDLAARVEARLATLSPMRTEVRATTLGDTAILRGALLTARDAAQEALFP